MAITTLDQLVAGMRPPFRWTKANTPTLVAGKPTSLWALAGCPGAGAFDNTLNGVTLSSSSAQVAGAIPHWDPASGNSYLARFSAMAQKDGILSLLDRIWHNGNISATSTSAQNITSPTWPSRCPTSGTNDAATTTGIGVQLALEVSAATGSGTPTITVSYTNSDGTSGRTATNIIATQATSATGSVYFLSLQAGDVGVKSVESITLSATWTSGTINLVAFRSLLELEMVAGIGCAADAVTGGLPRLYNGVVPWIVFTPSTTTALSLGGSFVEAQG